MNIRTQSVHLPRVSTPDNAVSPPIFQTATYVQNSLETIDRIYSGQQAGYTYTRGPNPNVDALADAVAQLEGAPSGLITSSGMSAITAAMLSLGQAPQRLTLAREIYGGTLGMIRGVLEPLGYKCDWVDMHQLDEVESSLRRGSRIVICESLSNPMCRVIPLPELVQLAHGYEAAVIVDNTIATPFHLNPLTYGCDLVVHSVTKFLGGHSDVVLGAIVGSPSLIEKARSVVDTLGMTPDPMAAWLAFRGMRTFGLRMERSSENAMALADALSGMMSIDSVFYPGLPTHPDFPLAQRLFVRGNGPLIAIRIQGGRAGVERVIARLQIVELVPSLGDVATTVSHPVVASHREFSPQELQQIGVDEGILRISVGIEEVHDIIDDFAQALGGFQSA